MRRRSDGSSRRVHRGHILAEETDEAAGRAQRQKQQAQQRCLAGARRAGEEAELARLQREGNVLQHLRPVAIAQTHIFQSNQDRDLLASRRSSLAAAHVTFVASRCRTSRQSLNASLTLLDVSSVGRPAWRLCRSPCSNCIDRHDK